MALVICSEAFLWFCNNMHITFCSNMCYWKLFTLFLKKDCALHCNVICFHTISFLSCNFMYGIFSQAVHRTMPTYSTLHALISSINSCHSVRRATESPLKTSAKPYRRPSSAVVSQHLNYRVIFFFSPGAINYREFLRCKYTAGMTDHSWEYRLGIQL